jgi:hypothetical protein
MKLVAAKLKLAALGPGASVDRPIDVASASVIEVHAMGLPCVACDEHGVRLDDHAAKNGLRHVKVRCTRCGHVRELVFRIAQPS